MSWFMFWRLDLCLDLSFDVLMCESIYAYESSQIHTNLWYVTQICDVSHKSRHEIYAIWLVYVLICVTCHVTCMHESCHAYQSITYVSHVSILDAWYMRHESSMSWFIIRDFLIYVTLLIHVTFLYTLRYSYTHDICDMNRLCLVLCDMSRHLYAYVMSRISIRHVTHRYASGFQGNTLRREAERLHKEFI